MSERIEHLDEGMIHAWLDGALSPDESARVESHATACADCAALVAEARGLVAASSRILASLDAVPAGVVPGSVAGTDQLAVLRARRAADSRRWWRDRRFVAAASLVLVAGVSSVVWRTAGNQSPVAPEYTRVIDTVMPPAAAPGPGPAESKTEAAAPLRDAAPALVVTRPADSAARNAKVAATVPAPRPAELIAESRAAGVAGQQTKVAANTARAEQSTNVQRQVQQQDAAAPQRFAVELQRADSLRPAAPPPTAAALSRNRSTVAPAMVGAGFRLPGLASPAGKCFDMRRILTDDKVSEIGDTVRFLEQAAPERNDSSWRRALYESSRPNAGVLSWRQVDSVTVELHERRSTDSSVLRFLSGGIPLYRTDREVVVQVYPDPGSLPSGVRAAWGIPVDCR